MRQNESNQPASTDFEPAHFDFAVEGSRPVEHAKRIQSLLRKFAGVADVIIHAEEERVTISFDPGKTNPPAIHDYLLSHGYKPSASVAH